MAIIAPRSNMLRWMTPVIVLYLTAPGFSWKAYSGKDKNGGHCIGNLLGDLPDKCVNLDNHFDERIRCVLWDR